MTPPKFLPSTIAHMVDVMVFVASGLIAFYSYEVYQDVRLDFERYTALILLGAALFIFLSNRLYRSWRSEGFFKLIQSIGAVIDGGSVAEFTKFAQSEIKRYEGIVKMSGAQKE